MHLCDFPEAGRADAALETAMAVARETVRLGLAARGHGKLKVRQPLRAAVVVAAGAERAAIERMRDIVLEELNVKELRFVSEADELGSYEVKPNYRALGPRFGKQMPQVAAAVAALEPATSPARCATAVTSGSTSTATTTSSAPTTCTLAMQPLDGYQLEREGSHAIALELELDDELRREGLARELVHAVQNARKAAGLQVEDRIELGLGGDPELLAAAREHEDYLAQETLATSVAYEARRAARRRPSRAACSGHRPELGFRPATSACERGLDLRLEALLRHRALDALGDLAVAEEQERRDRHDLVLRRGLDVLVGVELDDLSSGRSPAISSTIGATMRHGPHHGAQKSTRTGWSDSMTSAWKLVSVTSVTPAMSLLVAGVTSKRIVRAVRPTPRPPRRPG